MAISEIPHPDPEVSAAIAEVEIILSGKQDKLFPVSISPDTAATVRMKVGSVISYMHGQAHIRNVDPRFGSDGIAERIHRKFKGICLDDNGEKPLVQISDRELKFINEVLMPEGRGFGEGERGQLSELLAGSAFSNRLLEIGWVKEIDRKPEAFFELNTAYCNAGGNARPEFLRQNKDSL